MPLQVEMRGTGPPLVLLHGFTQTGRLWGPLGTRLAECRTLIAVDLPGHGGSDAVRADLQGTAELVAEAVRRSPADVAGAAPYEVLGYSLGARVALHVLTGTDLPVGRSVLIGATGGLSDSEERARRRHADEALAERLEETGDVERFVDEWLARPMFARLTSAAGAGRSERLRNGAAGLASSLRLCGTGTQAPLWDQLTDVSCPLLFLAGADDTRFAALALRLAHTVPHGAVSLVPGGGHAAHLAQPDVTWRIVRHWLEPDAH